jgi:N-acetylglucosamine-6-phosphate deacetylase
MGRYDTLTGDPLHILKIADEHGKFGTGSILPTIYSGQIDRMRENMEAVKKAIELQSSDPRLLEDAADRPDGRPARIQGVHLEGPFLNPRMCGALERNSFLTPSLSALKKLIHGFEDIVKIITVAPEIRGSLKVIEKCAEAGFKVNMGHSDATYRQALEGKKAGATGVTHIFNAMRAFHHREPGLPGLGLLEEDLFIEVIADGVHLNGKTLELIFGIKRPDRILLVSDSVKGRRVRRMPVYDEKGILAGSTITLRDAVAVLTRMGIPEAEAMRAAVENPARYLAGANT